MSNKLKIGFSPCPNDTFMFNAMVNGLIDMEGIELEVVMEDVEALNRMAFKGELDITKLSYHAYAYLRQEYQLLKSGSALGKNCGPILISKRKLENIDEARIAIPGKYTTANFLLSLAYPNAQQKKEMLFSDIERAVLEEKVDAGLIIHENRFTYQDKGLLKVRDLGEFWEEAFSALIPLGGIAIKRNFPQDLKLKVENKLRESIQFAFDHPKQAYPFIKEHAQEMDEKVMYSHIDLYVNQYSLDLGTEGRAAIELMFKKAEENGIIPSFNGDIFVK